MADTSPTVYTVAVSSVKCAGLPNGHDIDVRKALKYFIDR